MPCCSFNKGCGRDTSAVRNSHNSALPTWCNALQKSSSQTLGNESGSYKHFSGRKQKYLCDLSGLFISEVGLHMGEIAFSLVDNKSALFFFATMERFCIR